MSAPLMAILDDLGSECVGPLWATMRGAVSRWMQENPVKVARLRRRIIAAVEEGSL